MQSMQLTKKKAIGGMLEKKKTAIKPIGKLTPTPITIGNPRSTNAVPNQEMSDFQQAVMPNGHMMQNGRQDALQRMMMMRKSPLKQTPLNKFKPIGIPQQPISPQELYMQRMMQQMQAQQGRYQF